MVKSSKRKVEKYGVYKSWADDSRTKKTKRSVSGTVV